MSTIAVSRETLEWLGKQNSCSQLTEDRAKCVWTYRGRLYVPTGSCSSGAEGMITVWIQECVPADQYQGKENPMTYLERHHRVRKGEEWLRGYHFQKFTVKGQEYVFLDNRIDVTSQAKAFTQATLF